MVNLVEEAFDKGDEYRMPAMILSDGMLGQMMEPVVLPQGSEKKLPKKKWAACGHGCKRPRNVVNSLYIQPHDLERLVNERYERYERIKEKEQKYESYLVDDAEIIVVAYGASSRVSRSAIDTVRDEGIKAGLIRPITLWPFPEKALSKAADGKVKAFLTVEMSTGQMVDDVRLVVNGRKPVEFFGRTGGVIPTPNEVADKIRKMAGGA